LEAYSNSETSPYLFAYLCCRDGAVVVIGKPGTSFSRSILDLLGKHIRKGQAGRLHDGQKNKPKSLGEKSSPLKK
jgi:hypothetical protein